MDERKKPGWPFWFVACVIVLPVLYIASSGPSRMIAVRSFPVPTPVSAVPTPTSAAPGSPIGLDFDCSLGFVEEVDAWWAAVYAPLTWAADCAWGEPLYWYWDLFPID
jgi:hypothetical protein